MKTTKNRGNGEFFIMPRNHVSDLMGLLNHPGTLNLWDKVMKTSGSGENDEFFA